VVQYKPQRGLPPGKIHALTGVRMNLRGSAEFR